jgi:peptidoglycan hydrolase FlgJ
MVSNSSFSSMISSAASMPRPNPAEMPQLIRPGVKAGQVTSEAEAMRVGREFEQMFLSEMLRPMFEGIGTNKWFGGGNGEKMFRSLQVDEYGKGLSKAGGVGIAEAVKREIIRMQETSRVPAAA